MTDGCINDEQPERTEYQHRGKSHSLSKAPNNQCGGDDRKCELKHDEQRFGNRSADTVHTDFSQKEVPQIADEWALLNP